MAEGWDGGPVNGIDWRPRRRSAEGSIIKAKIDACDHPWGNRKTSPFRRMYCGNCDVDFEPWQIVNPAPDQAVGIWRETDRELASLRAELERTRLRLPHGMEHCQILFRECSKGHGRLTATNWLDNGCPVCEIEKAFERGRMAERIAQSLPWPVRAPGQAEPIGGSITSPDKPAPKIRLTEEILASEGLLGLAEVGRESEANVDPTIALGLLRERASARPDRMRPLPTLDPRHDYRPTNDQEVVKHRAEALTATQAIQALSDVMLKAGPRLDENVVVRTVREMALEEAARAVEAGAFKSHDSPEYHFGQAIAAMLRRRKGFTSDHVIERMKGEGVYRRAREEQAQVPRSTMGEFEG